MQNELPDSQTELSVQELEELKTQLRELKKPLNPLETKRIDIPFQRLPKGVRIIEKTLDGLFGMDDARQIDPIHRVETYRTGVENIEIAFNYFTPQSGKRILEKMEVIAFGKDAFRDFLNNSHV